MRYLIFGGPGIGDTVYELSLAKALKEMDSSSKVDLLIHGDKTVENIIREILDCQNYIDNLVFLKKGNYISIFFSLFYLIFKRYDYGFSCAPNFYIKDTPVRICKIINCKSVVKYFPKKSGNADINVNINNNIHWLKQYEKLIQALYPSVFLDIDVFDKASIQSPFSCKFKKRITLVLGTNAFKYHIEGRTLTKNIKEWDVKRWVKLGNCLSELGYEIFYMGGKKEKIELEIAGMVNIKNRYNILCGKTTIKESLSILNSSDLVIGGDTGMLHCAAALSVPTISLFGGSDYRIYAPYSIKNTVIVGKCPHAPCHFKTKYAINCFRRKCMESISVEDVINVVKEKSW